MVGTRPEAIKMAPVIKALRNSSAFQVTILATAQHREMLDQVFEHFDIIPDIDLNIMQNNQTLYRLHARLIERLTKVIGDLQPNIVLAQGDTTTVLAAALAAFYNHVCFGHIEAGLRSYNKFAPWPEEMNRVLVSHLTDIHFAPTKLSRQSLLLEGIPKSKIYVTGNTVIDALQWMIKRKLPMPINLPVKARLILVTAHRRENFGLPLQNICQSLLSIVRMFEDVHIVYPVHPNPAVRRTVFSLLGAHKRIHLLKPLSYSEFVACMQRAWLIMTDSGGIQEEAPSLGKPVLVLRCVTERPEAVQAGTSILVGADKQKILNKVKGFLTNPKLLKAFKKKHNPYGNGKAAFQIRNILLNLKK